jgi:DNA mismatch endonuclease, patch repair protein
MARPKVMGDDQQASWASSPAVRAVMRGNRGRDTRPERAIRSAVHALGLRYRVGIRPVPQLRRTADIVFTRTKVAVFIDGCFWHGCPEHYRPARLNANFWNEKIKGNMARDIDTDTRLAEWGWRVVRAWEHESPIVVAERIRAIVQGASSSVD